MTADLRKRSSRFDSGERRPIYSGRSMAGRPNPGDPNNLWGGMSTGWQITMYLLVAVGVFGGLGYLIDWLAGTPKAFTAAGMVVGAAFGIYIIYVKYGREDGTRR
jgi:hypothetical protein